MSPALPQRWSAWGKFARLIKKEALAADVRGDRSEAERSQLVACHSLGAGLASSVETTKDRTNPSFQNVSDKLEIHEMRLAEERENLRSRGSGISTPFTL